MNPDFVKKNVTQQSIWLRGIQMVLFALIYSVAEMVMAAVAVLQFLIVLLTGGPNEPLREFGQGLSLYVYQIWRFLTFNSETLPFPFSSWPDALQRPDQPLEHQEGN